MRRWLSWLRQVGIAILPVALLFTSVLVMASPLSLVFGPVTVPLPLLPLMVLFYFSVYRPASLPMLAVFAIGLFQDVLFGGALGVWASIFLVTQLFVTTQMDYLKGRPPMVIWVAFGFCLLASGALLWAERSILAGRFLSVNLLVVQLCLTFAFYPVLHWALRGQWPHRSKERLILS